MKFETQFIEGRKQALLKEKAELEADLKELGKMPKMGEDSDSFEEETDEAEEYVTNLSKADSYSRELEEVNAALARIEKGVYGVCEKCGKEISRELLLIIPESELCKKCKAEKIRT